MATVLRSGPYRFFFYSSARDEPAHIRVEAGDSTARFWLDPVRLAGSTGFSRADVSRLHSLVEENRET